MQQQPDPAPTHPTPNHDDADPLSRRFASCAIWLIGYGLVWWLQVWRPMPSVGWVNIVVVTAIPLGTLPPARFRPLCASAAFFAVAAAMHFGVNNELFTIVLTVLGMFSLADGAFGITGRQ